MPQTLKQQAKEIIDLFKHLPVAAEGSAEKQFQQAVWSLCQRIQDLDSGESFVPGSSIMG